MRSKRLEAIVVGEKQAELIYVALMHCRDVLDPKKKKEAETQKELTEAARLFTWRD